MAGIQELTAAGVRLTAVSQGIDTDPANPTSRLLLRILAAVAEFERELIKERVPAGLNHAKAKEGLWGGPGASSTARRPGHARAGYELPGDCASDRKARQAPPREEIGQSPFAPDFPPRGARIIGVDLAAGHNQRLEPCQGTSTNTSCPINRKDGFGQ